MDRCSDFQRIHIAPAFAAADNGYLSFDAEPSSRVSEPINVEGPGPFDQWTPAISSSGDEVPDTHDLPNLITKEGETGTFWTSASILVLIFSCVVALLALACLGLGQFIIKHIRTQVLTSHTTWQILPLVEKRAVLSSCKRNSGPAWAVAQSVLYGKCERLLYFGPRAPTLLSYISITTSDDLVEDSEDEKFHDALDITPSLSVRDLPPHDSPSLDLTSPPLTPTPSPTPYDRSTPSQMNAPPALDPEQRELPTRPSWSLRVATPIPAPPSLPLMHPRSRAYRAVPGFDIALAMQLRPGLGLGADPAWMVRFLMAIFGWFAVALTGGGR